MRAATCVNRGPVNRGPVNRGPVNRGPLVCIIDKEGEWRGEWGGAVGTT